MSTHASSSAKAQTFRNWELRELLSAPQLSYATYKKLTMLSKPPKHAAPGNLVQSRKPPGGGWVRVWTFVRPQNWGAPRCPSYRYPVWEFEPDKYAAKLEAYQAYQASAADAGTDNVAST